MRVAATHFPILRSFLRCVYSALNSHKCVAEIDEALSSGDFTYLMTANEIDSFQTLLSNEVQTSHEFLDDGKFTHCPLRRPDLEKDLQIKHAKIIALYKKELEDYPENPCCSCNLLMKRKLGTTVKFTDPLGRVWPALKDFILKEDPDAAKKALFMCHYCKSSLRSNRMPPRCVLNGLQTVPVPQELATQHTIDSTSQSLPNCCQARYIHQ